MMRRRTWSVSVVLCFVGAWQLGGCNIIIQIPPVELDLVDAGAAEFVVEAGTPVQKTIQFGGSGVATPIGGGSIRIDPSVISITPANMGAGKVSVGAQTVVDVQTCLDACELAGVDAASCSNVCEESELLITVQIGPLDDINSDCANGDEYSFRVTLDDNNQPVSVSVTPNVMAQSTADLLASGEPIGVCVTVLSPISATVVVSTVTINITL